MDISVSILSAKGSIEEIINKVNKSMYSYIHLDIMDNDFVHNTSFFIDDMDYICKSSKKPLDIHLMVNNPKKYIDQYSAYNPNFITIHKEIQDYDYYLKYIKNKGIKAGLSINPTTSVESIIDDLDNIDLLLIMSVTPGHGGQTFINETINRIVKVKDIIKNKNLNVLIEVDGGINSTNYNDCIISGADILVMGSYITKNADYNDTMKEIKQLY